MLQKFLESSAAQSRRSFDESHPSALSKSPQKPADTIRRSSSFKVIEESSDDEEGESPGRDLRAEIEQSAGVAAPFLARLQPAPAPRFPPPPAGGAGGGARAGGTLTPNSLSVPPSDSERRGSRASSRGSLSSDYGWAGMRETSLPPEEDCTSLITSDCFHFRDVPIFEDDEDEEDPYHLDAENVKRIYLSSKQMMDNFSKSQFYEVARSIKKGHLTSGAKRQPLTASIVCREEEEDTDPVKERLWYYMPSLEVPFFPREYFIAFTMRYLKLKVINKQRLFELEISRKREKMRHIKTGHVYQWPSEKMVTHITKLGCNLVPVGLHNKDKSRNPDSSIEWEVMFTKAEQYMTRNLHHPKVRVYLFSLLMLKCHFEKFDGLRQVNNPLEISSILRY